VVVGFRELPLNLTLTLPLELLALPLPLPLSPTLDPIPNPSPNPNPYFNPNPITPTRTHDSNLNQTGQQAGNLYFELNNALRERGPGRVALLQLWGGFLYYLLSGLAKLENTQGVVYRGYPDKAKVEQQYQLGRPIQWGAFSSTAWDASTAKLFTDRDSGVILKLT